MEPDNEPIPKITLPRDPLQLNQLLIQNVNTWGNVQYNIPLRTSSFETRTGTNVAHRFIPRLSHHLDVKNKDPLPVRVTGRDMVVEKETYRTTSGEFDVKPNPNKAMERADRAGNCRNVIYMTGVEKRLQRKTIVQPQIISEMKDNFRGLTRSPLIPPDYPTKAPDPEYMCDVVAMGRNEVPCIPETAGGYRRLLDPYLTNYRKDHRPWTEDEQYGGIAAKDHITLYSEFNTPRVRGFGPRHKEMWMPLMSKRREPIYDKEMFKKEYHEVAASHNPVNNIKGIFETESQKKYRIPYTVSELATFDHGEMFHLAPYPPNPWQTNIAPFMYCSDYCHISQGTPPYCVIEQHKREFPAHKDCVEKRIVSRL
ncbi:hypothetical protein O0L34_g13950 [Tuta absoluta]|nr:hypothetical protein O0L34_g13950 [Tuta absoluta]